MNMRRGTTAATFAAVLVGLALAPAATHATRSATNGMIAFSRYRYVDSPVRKEIWVVNPDGSGLRQVTHAPANYLDYDPTWSPDGSKLLFSRCAPFNGSFCDGENSVWSVNRDGSHLHMLTPACRGSAAEPSSTCPQDGQASYSPDGLRIASLRFTGVSGIAIGDDSLRHVREIFPFGKKPPEPALDALVWSPDGTRLAFAVHNIDSKHYKPSGGRAIFVINANGTGLHRLTPWRLSAGGIGELDWSTYGILFHSITAFAEEPSLSNGDIYTIRPNGSGLQRLTHFPAGTGVQLGSYSPDGTKIVFATTNNATAGPASYWPDLFTMNADGSNITPLTRTKNWEGTPDWGTG